MPVARLGHLDRLILGASVNHKIRQVALANQQITQEVGSLGNLLRHHLLSVLISQPNLDLAPVIVAAAFLARNLQQTAVSLDKATLLRRHNKVVASSVLQEEQLAASVQEVAPGLGLVPAVVYSVATINSSSNSRSRSHSVGQLPPLELSERPILGLEPPTMPQTIPAVYSAALARITLLLGRLSSSLLNKTHLAALELKIKTRPILNQPSEGLVPSSNKSKSQADCLATRMQTTRGEVVFLEI